MHVKYILENESIKNIVMPEFTKIITIVNTTNELVDALDDFKKRNNDKIIQLVTSLKGVLGRKTSIKNVVVSALLDICKIYLQPKLLR